MFSSLMLMSFTFRWKILIIDFQYGLEVWMGVTMAHYCITACSGDCSLELFLWRVDKISFHSGLLEHLAPDQTSHSPERRSSWKSSCFSFDNLSELNWWGRWSLVIEVADLPQLLVRRPLKVLPCSCSLPNHLPVPALLHNDVLIGMDFLVGPIQN